MQSNPSNVWDLEPLSWRCSWGSSWLGTLHRVHQCTGMLEPNEEFHQLIGRQEDRSPSIGRKNLDLLIKHYSFKTYGDLAQVLFAVNNE
jgi:hypothetical protein